MVYLNPELIDDTKCQTFHNLKYYFGKPIILSLNINYSIMLLCGFKIQVLNSMFVLINLFYDTSRMGTLKLSVFLFQIILVHVPHT